MQVGLYRLWKRRNPIAPSLRIAHQNLVPREVDIFYSQPQTFEKPQAPSVKKPDHKLRQSLHSIDHSASLGRRQNNRNSLGTLRSHQIAKPWQWIFQHDTIQKQDSRQPLILRVRTL